MNEDSVYFEKEEDGESLLDESLTFIYLSLFGIFPLFLF